MLIDYGLDLTKFENRKALLLHDYRYFLLTFFELKNGVPFAWSNPMGRRSHFDIIAEELTAVFEGKTQRLIINVPPGYAKSTMLVYFVAWTIARYPDSNTLYISYAFELAEKHTATIKEIIEMPAFKEYFDVELRHDSNSRSNFKTVNFGVTRAFGSEGSVTGQDGGRPHMDRYSGCVIIDDPIKPKDGHSETVRTGVTRNYNETIKARARGVNVPIIFIGQRIHEDDLAQFLIDGRDGGEWRHVILEALDDNENPLYPEYHGRVTEQEKSILSKEQQHELIVKRAREWLHNEAKYNEYAFWAQMQQRPQPAGGGIFKLTDFVLLDLEPHILSTFITIDTAESTKDWADYTAMSFWGVYKIVSRGMDMGVYGVHWLDARQMRIEPKDLEAAFFDFYAACMRHKVKPAACYIEKASTGVTLASVLKTAQGLRIIDVERTKATGGSKTARFYAAQPYIAKGQLSLTKSARHTEMCLEHMRKITGNDSHAHDDLADTAQMAIQCALIDGIGISYDDHKENEVMDALAKSFSHTQQMRARR